LSLPEELTIQDELVKMTGKICHIANLINRSLASKPGFAPVQLNLEVTFSGPFASLGLCALSVEKRHERKEAETPAPDRQK